MKKGYSGRLFNLAAVFCFLLAIGLVLLLRFFSTDEFTQWYARYNTTLENYESWIETNGATVLTVVIILINYYIKAYLPWFPISCLCVASAVVFKWYIASAINLAGLALFFAVKFRKGRRHGGGKAEKMLEKYRKPHDFIESGSFGSKAVLFFSRLLPGVPLGAVSVFYGSTEMKFGEYMLVSLFGILYKLFTYITIGRNVFDPASISFVGPFIPLLVFTGFVMLSIGGVTRVAGERKRKRRNKKI